MSLEKVTEQYKSKTGKSADLFQKSLVRLPGGIGGSAPTFNPYPMFIKRGEGSKVWDVDGNEYLDFNLCWGVLIVGHRHPKIMEGLQDQLKNGTIFGLPHEESIEVANSLADRFPIDKVRFVNSGSEANLYAARLARRYTGKDKIIKIEGAYHGVADSLHISKRPTLGEAGPYHRPSIVPYGDGITSHTAKDTIIAPFNNIEVIKKLLNENLGEVAAVIVEPVMMNAGVVPPEEGYHKALRELTNEHNVVFIFDEVKTGVKLAPGGATEYFDVKPDLVCLAKAIGGGLPIGACGGKGEIINGIDSEGLFGTYSANPLSIRAAKITLTEVLTNDSYKKLEKVGNTLLAGYQDIIVDHKLEAIVQGINANGGILFVNNPVTDYRTWTKVDKAKTHHYWLSMANEGIIPMAYGADEEWLVSVQHSEEDINMHLEAFKKVAPNL
ncbi:MAG: aspartate aminotransferase family protein [Candidatus Thorarchaeota archaeon]|jgi:glutamate-1-semialdehyde 2,1-aminomutase